MLGYSFPPTDLLVRQMVATCWRGDRVIVADRTSDPAERLRQLLGTAVVSRTGDDPIPAFVAEEVESYPENEIYQAKRESYPGKFQAVP